jgi:protein phosphatase
MMTHFGRVRERNEDNYLFANLTKSSSTRDGSAAAFAGIAARSDVLMLLVADGMGGHARGDVASRGVVEHFARFLESHSDSLRWASNSADDCRDVLCREIKRCHTTLRRRAQSPDLRGMGSTATVAVVAWPKLFLAHVGDSRCYLFRENKAQQITRDHSVAQYLVDEGSMKASLVDKSPFRHQLWNVLGANEKGVTVDFHDLDLRGNDAILLCTDGLTNRLSDLQLVEHMRASTGVAETCGGLVAAANAAGGQDNITCGVFRLAAETGASSTPTCSQPFSCQSSNEMAN